MGVGVIAAVGSAIGCGSGNGVQYQARGSRTILNCTARIDIRFSGRLLHAQLTQLIVIRAICIVRAVEVIRSINLLEIVAWELCRLRTMNTHQIRSE